MGREAASRAIGILGGGQLGLMLAEASRDLPYRCRTLDRDGDVPAARAAPVTLGDVNDPVDVARFGGSCDIVTIEREAVSVRGLEMLESAGVEVYPQPHLVARIQDKGRQKRWLARACFPTASFRLFDGPTDVALAVARGELTLPFVQKTRRAGYDGRGVKIVRYLEELGDLLAGPCLVEDCVDVAHELSVIVARSTSGEVVAYDPVEMRFRQDDNILDLLLCPAGVDESVAEQARVLGRDVAVGLGIVGVLAVEMFVDHRGHLWVNELAPRPHNSGHHTIELCATSQYEQHLRAITGHELGSTERRATAVLLNLLGTPGHRGRPRYVGLDALRRRPGVHVHVYGKKETWPLRKMGHVTIVDDSLSRALCTAETLRPRLAVRAVS